MRSTHNYCIRVVRTLLVSFVALGLSLQSVAQNISVWQFRKVDQANMEEFIERETKYWSKVAEAAIEKGNLQFWGLFVKQGGFNMPNTPNVLFINTFKDIDADMSEIWNASAVFPDVSETEMETFSISTTLHTFFVRPENFITREGSNPPEDFRFVRFIFHNASAPADLIALENEHWAPFIKSAMDAGKTTQVAWGNATILAPSAPFIEGTTISFDIYSSLKDALVPSFDEDVVIPEEGLNKINELEISRRINNVYRRIQVINANPPN